MKGHGDKKLYFYLMSGVLVFAASLSILPAARAGNGPGTSGLVILKQIMGPRPSSLGGAFVAISDDINALQNNPAGMVNAKHFEMTAMLMRKYVSRMEYQYAAFIFPGEKSDDFSTEPEMTVEQKGTERLNRMKRAIMALMTREELIQYTKEQIQMERERISSGNTQKPTPGPVFKSELRYAFGASYLDFNAGEMIVEYVLEDPVTIASAQHDYVVTLGGAFGNDIFGVGINLKYVDSSLLDNMYHTHGMAIDIGGMFTLPDLEGGVPMRFGGCIQNIGFAEGYTDYKEGLPVVSRLGVSTVFNLMKLLEINFDIIPTIEGAWPVDGYFQFAFGCEASTELRKFSGDRMMLRVGYRTGRDVRDYLTFGLGFRLANLQFDASGVPVDFAGFDFGGLESNMMIAFSVIF